MRNEPRDSIIIHVISYFKYLFAYIYIYMHTFNQKFGENCKFISALKP